ncbi:hypothetical protein V130003_08070 [Vibrio cholerae]|nr:hypothetical protein V130003_08070 [Vibrio cholerae]
MNLHEYQAKQLFAEFGLPVPEGYACDTPQEAFEAAGRISTAKKVVKCKFTQVDVVKQVALNCMTLKKV